MDEASDRVFDLLAALVEVTAGAGYPRTSDTIHPCNVRTPIPLAPGLHRGHGGDAPAAVVK
jgi:hypothetical protein